MFPEVGPALPQSVAEVNIWVIASFLVFDTGAVPSVSDKLAGRKIAFQEG